MQFFAYIVVVLVSIGGILVELDWLTKPKLETKSPVQVATAVVPPRPVPKAVGPAEDPSAVATKKPEAEQANAAPLATNNSAPAETTGAAPAAQGAAAPPVTPAPVQPVVTNAKADAAPPQAAPPPQLQAATNAAPPPAQPQAQVPAAQPQAPTASPQPVQAAATQAPNSCDVAGCASAYQSFRASDCSYQPMEGPRKICSTPPRQRSASAPREPNMRRPNRDAELRDVERAIRRIPAGEADDGDSGIDRRLDRRMGRGEVILIERPDRDW